MHMYAHRQGNLEQLLMRLMVDQWNDICWLAAYAPSQFSAVVPAH